MDSGKSVAVLTQGDGGGRIVARPVIGKYLALRTVAVVGHGDIIVVTGQGGTAGPRDKDATKVVHGDIDGLVVGAAVIIAGAPP